MGMKRELRWIRSPVGSGALVATASLHYFPIVVTLIILVSPPFRFFYIPIANYIPIAWVEAPNFYRRQEALNIVDIASRLQDVDMSAVGSRDAKIARVAMMG